MTDRTLDRSAGGRVAVPSGSPGTRPPSPGRNGVGAGEQQRPGSGLAAVLPRLDSPLAAYYLVLGSTMALTLIGLIMVLSSSSVVSLAHTGSSFAVFSRQALFAVIALPLAVVAARLPVRAWTFLSWPLLLVSAGGLALVLTGLGKGVNGNRNWIEVAGFTLQPSEGAKFALVVWGAAVLARKRPLLHHSVHAMVPVVFPVSGVLLGMVLLGHDLGTALVLMGLVASLLWVAGVRLRVFVTGAALGVLTVAAVLQTRRSRMERIDAWLSGSCTGKGDYLQTCWQSVHGKWALASGGWWGVGLGASREKWSWLPEAHNDFIFAVIGEELGLAGTLVVLALFGVLGFGLYLVVVRSDDPFVKVVTGGVMTWILGQAIVNVGAVVGVLPVVGVPLPLVSSGGSALVTTLTALGMVIGFARREPGVAQALAAREGVVRRSLAVLPGRPHPRARRGVTHAGRP